MNYDPDRLIIDYVLRTRRNLDFIDQAVWEDANAEVYEVTQLVNSMLGLLVFPFEKYRAEIPSISLAELQVRGWAVPQVAGNFPQAEDLPGLIRYLRNAVAHFNLEFTADHRNQISGVKVWNVNRGGQKNWEANLGITELRDLTARFVDLILENQPATSQRMPEQPINRLPHPVTLRSDFRFDHSSLDQLASRTLFYPCSGMDWKTPIRLFAPEIDDFWFVDTDYFSDGRVHFVAPLLQGWRIFEHLNSRLHLPDLEPDDWLYDKKYRGLPPYILTETYRHCDTGKTITVHRHRRRGPSALRKQIDRLGVFFYRGDSDEGGSGTIWLSATRRWTRHKRKALIHEVLEKLVDGGLIVTDGSMGDNLTSNPYRHFFNYKSFRDLGPRVTEHVQPFEDLLGNRFDCIGYAGKKYGPTLIWRVSKAERV